MQPSNVARAALSVLALTLLAGGCGSEAPGAGERTEPVPSSSVSSTPGKEAKEPITIGGVAAIVEERVGAKGVRLFGTYGSEPGSVGVMIRLRNATMRDMFLVDVYSPEHARSEFGALTECPPNERAGNRLRRMTCRELENGTKVSAYLVPSGFSDDNRNGVVVGGMAAKPDGSGVLVMYESYDASPPVGIRDIERLLADRRLTWQTDPAVNEAGRAIKIRKLDG